MNVALYYSVIILELIFAISMFAYIGLLLYSSIMGSPYVPTKQREVDFMLSHMQLKKGQYLLELGSGDGRLLLTAAAKYGVTGLGVDVNPWVIAKANLLKKIKKVKGIEFKVQNLWDTDVSRAHVIYLFLMPELLKKLVPLIQKKARKGAIVVSHGFELHALKKKLVKKLDRKPFPTYIYRLS